MPEVSRFLGIIIRFNHQELFAAHWGHEPGGLRRVVKNGFSTLNLAKRMECARLAGAFGPAPYAIALQKREQAPRTPNAGALLAAPPDG